jgi:hypothetical protein
VLHFLIELGKSLDEIKNVNGIGNVLYGKIKNYFYLNEKVADNG